MKSFAIAAITAAIVSFASIGTASALSPGDISPEVIDILSNGLPSGGNGGASSMMGEPLNPNVKAFDVKQACAEVEGELIREIQSNGVPAYRCFVPKH